MNIEIQENNELIQGRSMRKIRALAAKKSSFGVRYSEFIIQNATISSYEQTSLIN